ncbi:MAG: NAD kinase [Bacteroidales bacterium]|nr:NAD kinase [Bacteroidales bacterium]
MKKLGLFSNKLKQEYIQEYLRAISWIENIGFQIYLHERLNNYLKKFLTKKYETYNSIEEVDIDLLLTFGGDGAFIEGVHVISNHDVPIIGVNIGRLGFLASININSLEDALYKISNGETYIEKRTLLELISDKKLNIPHYAINEFTVFKSDFSSMIGIEVNINERYFNTFWADGLIIATPTGSTAYSLSAGGPIIYPQSSDFIITPVACHNLNVRPFVLPDDYKITIKIHSRSDTCMISMDNYSQVVSTDINITLKKSQHKVKLLLLRDYDFFNALRTKLNWGIDRRN